MHMKELQERLDLEFENPENSTEKPIIAVSCTPGMTHTPLMDAFFAENWKVQS